MNFKNDPDFANASLSRIQKNLVDMFGEKWYNHETEAISLELGVLFTHLLLDKIEVLKLLSKTSLFYEDVLFFSHAVSVINNSVADFDTFPVPTSLELAYGIFEAALIAPTKVKPFYSAITEFIKHILQEEGYSEVLFPFNKILSEKLESGQ